MHAWQIYNTKLVALYEASSYAKYKLVQLGKPALAICFEGTVFA